MRLPAVVSTLLCIAATAVVVAGCGKSATPGAAALVPAESIVYGEVTLDPEGDSEEAVRALAARFPGGDDLPAQIEKGLTQSLREGGLDYKTDVKPWLGKEAAFFLSEVSEDKAEGAVVFETDDPDAALKAFEKAGRGTAKKRSYEGTDVFVDPDTAYAVVDDRAVFGTEAGVKAAIDTSDEGAKSIEDSDRAAEALDRLDDPLAALYVDGRKLVGKLGGAQAQLAAPFLEALDEPYVIGVSAEDDAVVVDSTVPRAVAALFLPFAFGSGTDAIEALPGDSWFAAGQPEIGKTVEKLLDLVQQSGAFGAEAETQFKTATGLDLREDVLSWMGDLTVFSRGTSVSDLGVGVAIQTSDPEASKRTLDATRRLLGRQASSQERVGALALPGGGEGFTLTSPDLPEPVHAVLRGDQVVIAYGDAAAQDLLEPSDTLGDDEDFSGASDRLGEGFEPGSYLDLAPVLEFAESEGASDDPDFKKAKPYLEPIARVVGGTKEDGDVTVSRTRIEVR